MKIASIVLVLVTSPSLAWGQGRRSENVTQRPTFLNAPIRGDGRRDFVAAVNDVLSAGVTPENNANVLLWNVWKTELKHEDEVLGKVLDSRQPEKFFKTMGSREPSHFSVSFFTLKQFCNQNSFSSIRTDDVREQLRTAVSRPWKASEFKSINEWLTTNAAALQQIEFACQRPKYYSPLVVSSDENIFSGFLRSWLAENERNRAFSDALAARAMLRLKQGRIDEASLDLVNLHRLWQHLEKQTYDTIIGSVLENDSAVSQLDLLLVQLAQGNSAQLTKLKRAYQALPPLKNLSEGFGDASRFLFFEFCVFHAQQGFEPVFGEVAEYRETVNENDLETLREIFSSLDWDQVMKNGDPLFDRIESVLRQESYAKRRALLTVIDKELGRNLDDSLCGDVVDNDHEEHEILKILKEFNRPSSTKTSIAKAAAVYIFSTGLGFSVDDLNNEVRARQNRDNVFSALALASYQAGHNRYPDKLVDLVPKYLQAVPKDLFTGQAMTYVPRKDGYQLYSLGPNGKDDEGESKSITFSDDAPDDIGFQMPLLHPSAN